MGHCESTGAFGRAEDILHALRETRPDLDFLPQVGSEFRERLLTKPDSQLAEGNLPRDEVEAGLDEWRGLTAA